MRCSIPLKTCSISKYFALFITNVQAKVYRAVKAPNFCQKQISGYEKCIIIPVMTPNFQSLLVCSIETRLYEIKQLWIFSKILVQKFKG